MREEKQVNGKLTVTPIDKNLPTDIISGTNVYGFLTVSEDAKCGVCAHEIGHLGRSLIVLWDIFDRFSLWLARSL